MTPNRIKITMDGGTAEVYGDVFSDMLTCYYLQLSARQKNAQEELTKIDLGDDFRTEKFKAAVFNYDDAESRIKIVDEIEKVFKNGSTHGGTRPLPLPISYVQPGPKE